MMLDYAVVGFAIALAIGILVRQVWTAVAKKSPACGGAPCGSCGPDEAGRKFRV